jgi:hypothetical protein
MMTYKEARAIADERKASWEAYYESQGKPVLDEYEKCIKNAPEGIFNQNVVSRAKGAMIAAENDGRVYEYPSGLMAWGYGIPEEAYVSEVILNEPCWEVISRRDTLDW